VWDTQGRKYLDALGGIAVNTLGHGHPKLVPALQDQVGKLIHSSNYYEVPLQEQLAAKLCELSGLDNVFFCNSGSRPTRRRSRSRASTATTRASSARDRRLREGLPRPHASPRCRPPATRKVQAGFEPLVEGFVRVPLNDLGAVEEVARRNPNVVAVFLEVIQGEGGINVARADYLRGLRALCDERAGC
jgi:acetylornithine/N-succinyldiaminopimelate aminotransferase